MTGPASLLRRALADRAPADAAGARPSRRRRALLVAVASLTLTLGALFGERGYVERLRHERRRQQLAAEVALLERTNAALEAEVRRMEDDPTALERIAREDLGLGRPGEALVLLPAAVRDDRPRPLLP